MAGRCRKLFNAISPAVVVLALLGSTASMAAPGASGPVRIGHDRGGKIIDYALRTAELSRSGRQVRFSGACDSACTLHLSMPREQLCITRGASFGFHLPYGGTSRSNETARRYLWRSYPGWVKNWINHHGDLNHSIKRMDYAYARRHLNECSPAKPSVFAYRLPR